MKRAQDKIKDYIDAQAFDEVENLAGNPARALSAYRFTPATSELMCKWLDGFADLAPHNGTARALAGFRGVGKSHTMAAFGALIEQPDLRPRLDETHVRTSAQRLGSAPYTVVRVERGTRPTLIEELRAGFSAAFFSDESEWSYEDPAAILAVAASRAGNAPIAVLIDTSFGRQTRVHRDDGPMLSELAMASQQVRTFIGLALDDDIAGADGVNVSLVGSYQIDYLDPEHLYQVLDLHVFQKTPQSRAALHEVYNGLRTAIPTFNWSEPRFTTLYPLHPLVADVAPAIRLFAPTFALLPFAAAVFAKVTNRPAQSLVTLDEVFDRVEYELRKADDLLEPFRAFDRLVAEPLAQIPVMQRLQARLALKGLFLLSLDGRGATAAELCAAMLLFDEENESAPFQRVSDMLEMFGADTEAKLQRQVEAGGQIRYAFGVKASAGFESAMAASAAVVSDEAMNAVWQGLGRGRFGDWPVIEADASGSITNSAPFSIRWRGLNRPGRIVWKTTNDSDRPTENADPDPNKLEPSGVDWEVQVLPPNAAGGNGPAAGFDAFPLVGDEAAWSSSTLMWLPGPITADEMDTVRRLAALRSDTELAAEFGDTTRAAERTHAALAERIWSRIYLDSGSLLAGNARRNLPPAARTAGTLAEALTLTMAPLLLSRFPLHPDFSESLGQTEVAHLVGGLFGGANQGAQSVQELARLFALPLGLVALRGDIYTLEAGDSALRQPWTREVLALVDEADGDTVPIASVKQRLGGEPYGLSWEAQQLVLAGLVAQRRLELVLGNGERIARRMLDLKLAWDEVKGVARSAALLHSAEELTEWARLLTRTETLASIAEPSARDAVRKELSRWLTEWRESKSVETFESLPDEALTTRSWRLASGVRRSYGAAADAIEAALVDAISLEEGLQRAADAFADSIELFVERTKQLDQIRNYLSGLQQRDVVLNYLSAAEPTTIDEIENARSELSFLLSDLTRFFDRDSNKRFDVLWKEFHTGYSELYVTRHTQVAAAESVRAEIEAIVRSSAWREFEALSALSVFNSQYWDRASAMLHSVRELKCDLNVKQILVDRPFCACHFRLADAGTIAGTAQELEAVVRMGLAAYRATLSVLNAPLAIALDAIARKETDQQLSARARALSTVFARNDELKLIAPMDVRLLDLALHRMSSTTSVRVAVPTGSLGILTRDELKIRLNQWVDDLPVQPALLEIVSNSNGDDQT